MENKLLMKLFVASEAMFFLFLITTFAYYENTNGLDPHAIQSLSFNSMVIFTILLLLSSFTFWIAERNYKSGNRQKFKLWLLVTILLGVAFLFGEGKEYLHLFHEQITISKSVFGTNFFTLTGFHGLHVFIGIIVLLITLGLALAGDFKDTSSSVVGSVAIYWHFVDAVWVIVFTIIYILPRIS